MKKISIITAISLAFINPIYAQENCKVTVDALQGTYAGECKNGKAEGQGKATGIDTYEGNFKNGQPDGEGTYTWANKDVYVGNFRKGSLDGKGLLTYFTQTGKDSTLEGYWRKNKYIGKYDKPYIINDRTTKVNRIEISKWKKNSERATINLTASNFTGTPHEVNNIVVITGQFITKNSSKMTNSSLLKVQQIIFPFRGRFYFTNGEMVDITFNEEADYDVTVTFFTN